MGEVCAEAKTLIVNYRCDICGLGILRCVDSTNIQDDNGDWHNINTHTCSYCGNTVDIEDIKYPYNKLVPIEDMRSPKPDEML